MGNPPMGNLNSAPGDSRPSMGGQADPRQLQRELDQRLADAQELRRMLERGSPEARDLEQILQQLQKLTTNQRYNNPEGIAYLKQAIDRLHEVELALARDLTRLIQSDKFFYAEDSEVPASYKKLVDEYYKALAKGKR
jgi:hypothetical protein